MDNRRLNSTCVWACCHSKRFGNSEELIGVTLLLASDKAGSFITGTEMLVDGGYAAMTI